MRRRHQASAAIGEGWRPNRPDLDEATGRAGGALPVEKPEVYLFGQAAQRLQWPALSVPVSACSTPP